MNAAAIPIVGQQIVVLGFTVVVSAQCRCEKTGYVSLNMMQGQSGFNVSLGTCPSCRRQYQITGVRSDPRTGALMFDVNIGEPAPLVPASNADARPS